MNMLSMTLTPRRKDYELVFFVSRSASAILAAVKSTILAQGAKQVTIVGHSLGVLIVNLSKG